MIRRSMGAPYGMRFAATTAPGITSEASTLSSFQLKTSLPLRKTRMMWAKCESDFAVRPDLKVSG